MLERNRIIKKFEEIKREQRTKFALPIYQMEELKRFVEQWKIKKGIDHQKKDKYERHSDLVQHKERTDKSFEKIDSND